MFDDDRESHPHTQAFVPDFDDTDAQALPVVPDDPAPVPKRELAGGSAGLLSGPVLAPAAVQQESPAPAVQQDSPTGGVAAQSVTVPGRYLYLKWWKLVLVTLGVWAVAAGIGLGLFYWWFHSIHKTPAVFVVLVYIMACIVVSVMLAMTQGRPLLSALSLAVMSSPYAAVAAAAPLYGHYFCAHAGHCLFGVIPH